MRQERSSQEYQVGGGGITGKWRTGHQAEEQQDQGAAQAADPDVGEGVEMLAAALGKQEECSIEDARCQGKQIPPTEHGMAQEIITQHDHRAGHRQSQTKPKKTPGLLLEDQPGGERHPQRRGISEQRGIGGGGVFQRGIPDEMVQRRAHPSQDRQDQDAPAQRGGWLNPGGLLCMAQVEGRQDQGGDTQAIEPEYRRGGICPADKKGGEAQAQDGEPQGKVGKNFLFGRHGS